jgi:hypothetical protein
VLIPLNLRLGENRVQVAPDAEKTVTYTAHYTW